MPIKLWRRPDAVNGNWYVTGFLYVWRDGRKCKVTVKRESTGTADKDEAEAILLQIAARYQRANFDNQETPATVADLAVAYIEGREQTRYLEPIIKRLGHYEVNRLTQAIVDKEGRLAYPGVVPATLRRQWHGPLKAICNYSKVALPIDRPPDGAATTDFVTPAQMDAMILHAATSRRGSPWQAALLEALIGGGSRIGETLLLDTSDLNMDYATLRFRAENTKANRERTVKLPARTMAALSRLPNLREAGKLFRARGGNPYVVRKDSGAKMAFIRNAAEAAGVKDFNPHMIRHGFATWRLDQTKDYMGVRQAGGWGSIKLLERYAHVAPGIGDEARKYGWDWEAKSAEAVQVAEPEEKNAG
ncbi:tyrosine-type recombinase/integrase [Hyphomonas johnsonii]|uniref:Integrase family protein n=1 Tax=Hyphomonas johnsonii MHS-2 TaxID=1280950 RepID=A0A059FS97_9PROT|nr:tyrosine-type recombinase/integrase [Hyphomonas johnsonii]KCZ93525.1 integrase family protein [Hyphomonas johnsonii MHS-2]